MKPLHLLFLLVCMLLGEALGKPPKPMPGKVIEAVTDENEAEILARKGLVLLDFTASWCAPCRKFAPHYQALAEEFQGRAFFGKVDIDRSPRLKRKYYARVIPMLVFLKDGEIVASFEGLQDKATVREAIAQYL